MPVGLHSEYLLCELRAREAFTARDYGKASTLAEEGAALALSTDNVGAWWNIAYMRAEALREQGEFQDCAAVAEELLRHQISVESPALAARASTMLATALQGLGQLPRAIDRATEAARLSAGLGAASGIRFEALRALIAALAEADRLEPAWEQCRILSNMLSSESDPQNAGKTYWVMGNVAFLRNDAAEGTRFHRLASEHLSPGNDIYLWCRFNKASAAMRLSARVLEPETYECIERAELAISIIGGSERERLQISLNRAHWFYLTGELEQAAVILRRICAATSELAAQTLGEATLLLGKTLHAQGKTTEALDVLLASEVHFRAAGAEDRANHVLALAGKYSQQ